MFTLGEIAKACCGKLIAGEINRPVSGVSTDSRTIQAGGLFIALRGPHFDGHEFLEDAFRKGAACALVDRQAQNGAYPLVLVPDTLKALQHLASFYRSHFSITFVAITGSAGKTTTKECVGVLLSDVFRVRTGHGNWNNHIGVPLNLFSLSTDDQCLILELGANHVGEIALLSQIAQPTVGVITGIYPVHLEGFGSMERIYQAKLELADFLDRTRGTVIANGDDPELLRRLRGRQFHLITFGTTSHCNYVLSDLTADNGFIYFQVNHQFEFRLRGYGLFNAANALAAIATAGYFNLDLESLSRSWQRLPVIEQRFCLGHLGALDIELIDDSYNANPKSFEQAVASFSMQASGRRKIVVSGDMLELGENASSYHEALGRLLAERSTDVLIAVGPLSRFTVESFRSLKPQAMSAHFQNVEEAGPFVASVLREGDSLLIKGSHGTRLHEIKLFLHENFKTANNIAVIRS
ncbi:MAG: UDP-N-acetylmuramoyl-tripeptide--D-alanyl-D-alanine ligase [Candidatus Omnitrophica bacterium]|nr:UDP-N-acetylmuramoyl-tripeptide--D-alanyl-D-alanine ligase [Candidatus Omnitrophota bacterium]